MELFQNQSVAAEIKTLGVSFGFAVTNEFPGLLMMTTASNPEHYWSLIVDDRDGAMAWNLAPVVGFGVQTKLAKRGKGLDSLRRTLSRLLAR